MLEEFRRGPRAILYRPNPTLFLLLKVGRMSESDLADCLLLIGFSEANGLTIDSDRVRAHAEHLAPTADEALNRRRAKVLGNLT